MCELVINVQNLDGETELRHHTIKLGCGPEEPEINFLVEQWTEKLRNERWLNWEIELCTDDGTVHHTWDAENTDERPIFYMLTQEGYAWNSEIRDNIDIITKRIYKVASNA